MRLIDLTCSKCGALLKVDSTVKKVACEYCGNEMLIDDEIKHISFDNGYDFGYQMEKGKLQAMMQQNGYTCSAAVEKTLGGVNFITMEVSISGQKAIAALAKANAMYFIGITAMNQDNDIDYKLLEKIAPIINSAESTTVTNNMSSNTKLDMSGFAELAK